MKRAEKQKRSHERMACVCLFLLLAAFALSACGTSTQNTAASTTEAAMAWENSDYAVTAADRPAAEVMEEAAEEYDGAVEAGMDTGQAAVKAAGQENQNTAGRKLIREVSMEVETEAYDQLMKAVTEQVDALGGYIESSYTSGDERSGSTRYGEICARIPQDRMNDFIAAVEGSSNVRYKRENVEDVTLQYVDMESRKKALQTEQERLLELMEQAETVEDLIAIESRLSEVRYQLESIESQLRTYDNRIDYSTIYLTVSEVLRLSPASGDKMTVWDRISTGFSENLYRLGTDLEDLTVGFVISLPYVIAWLAVFLVLAGILLFIIRKVRRRRNAGAFETGRHRKGRQEARQQVQQAQGQQEQQQPAAWPGQQETAARQSAEQQKENEKQDGK